MVKFKKYLVGLLSVAMVVTSLTVPTFAQTVAEDEGSAIVEENVGEKITYSVDGENGIASDSTGVISLLNSAATTSTKNKVTIGDIEYTKAYSLDAKYFGTNFGTDKKTISCTFDSDGTANVKVWAVYINSSSKDVGVGIGKKSSDGTTSIVGSSGNVQNAQSAAVNLTEPTLKVDAININAGDILYFGRNTGNTNILIVKAEIEFEEDENSGDPVTPSSNSIEAGTYDFDTMTIEEAEAIEGLSLENLTKSSGHGFKAANADIEAGKTVKISLDLEETAKVTVQGCQFDHYVGYGAAYLLEASSGTMVVDESSADPQYIIYKAEAGTLDLIAHGDTYFHSIKVEYTDEEAPAKEEFDGDDTFDFVNGIDDEKYGKGTSLGANYKLEGVNTKAAVVLGSASNNLNSIYVNKNSKITVPVKPGKSTITFKLFSGYEAELSYGKDGVINAENTTAEVNTKDSTVEFTVTKANYIENIEVKYVGEFEEEKVNVTFNYLDENGDTVSSNVAVAIGSTAEQITVPQPADIVVEEEKHVKTFTGWTGDLESAVFTEDMTFDAQYTDSYKVVFNNYLEDEDVYVEWVNSGDTIKGDIPAVPTSILNEYTWCTWVVDKDVAFTALNPVTAYTYVYLKSSKKSGTFTASISETQSKFTKNAEGKYVLAYSDMLKAGDYNYNATPDVDIFLDGVKLEGDYTVCVAASEVKETTGWSTVSDYTDYKYNTDMVVGQEYGMWNYSVYEGDSIDAGNWICDISNVEFKFTAAEQAKCKVTFVVDGKTVSENTVLESTKVTKPADPTKEEDEINTYTFEGWYAEGSETAFDFNTAITEDITLVAKFTAVKKVSIYKELNFSDIADTTVLNDTTQNGFALSAGFGNSGKVRSVNPSKYIIVAGDVRELNKNLNSGGGTNKGSRCISVTPEQDGYLLVIAEANSATDTARGFRVGSVEYLSDGTIAKQGEELKPVYVPVVAGTTYKIESVANVNYYYLALVGSNDIVASAKTVKFVSMDGATNIVDVQSVVEGAAIAVPTEAAVKEKIEGIATFKGWTTTKPVAGTESTLVTPATTATESVTYYAVYELNKYAVTFENTELEAVEVEHGKKVAKPEADPTKTGFIFAGWYADEAFATEYDFNTAITAATTIYAKWLDEADTTKYTVTFVTNGGSVVEAQEVAESLKATKPANPTKAGSRFAGWYSDAACTTAFDFNTAITADVTVYAKFVEYTAADNDFIATEVMAENGYAAAPSSKVDLGTIVHGIYTLTNSKIPGGKSQIGLNEGGVITIDAQAKGKLVINANGSSADRKATITMKDAAGTVVEEYNAKTELASKDAVDFVYYLPAAGVYTFSFVASTADVANTDFRITTMKFTEGEEAPKKDDDSSSKKDDDSSSKKDDDSSSKKDDDSSSKKDDDSSSKKDDDSSSKKDDDSSSKKDDYEVVLPEEKEQSYEGLADVVGKKTDKKVEAYNSAEDTTPIITVFKKGKAKALVVSTLSGTLSIPQKASVELPGTGYKVVEQTSGLAKAYTDKSLKVGKSKDNKAEITKFTAAADKNFAAKAYSVKVTNDKYTYTINVVPVSIAKDYKKFKFSGVDAAEKLVVTPSNGTIFSGTWTVDKTNVLTKKDGKVTKTLNYKSKSGKLSATLTVNNEGVLTITNVKGKGALKLTLTIDGKVYKTGVKVTGKALSDKEKATNADVLKAVPKSVN